MDRIAHEEPEKLQELFTASVFNLERGQVYFPIRHHSPVCSHHLLHAIRAYKPDIILIEGPESGSALIPILSDARTETPVSLYCTYENEHGRKACYYPLLSYSPEYVAMKEAARLGIPAQFIDLDYDYDQLPDHSEPQGRSAQDESMLAGSEFIERLCAKTNSRSFDELWENVFEIGGLALQTEAFVRDVFTYCTLSRMCYSNERLRDSGDLAREARMREHVSRASAEYARVLVVTGGFHTYGLLQEGADEAGHALAAAPVRVGEASRQQLYPMVYTFEEADRLNGYASGMPYVNFYEMIWTKLLDGAPGPYGRAAVEWLAALTRKLREQQEHVSTSDAIEAYSMFQGLASLRGKREGGVYELLDATLSSFVKGERTLATEKPLEELKLLLTGDRIGIVAPNPLSIPIVENFKTLCRESGLQIKTTGKHKKVLELYGKPEHRRMSQLFQCIGYLVPDFATRQSGPDWLADRDMNLIRETWTYTYSSRIEARLIESSLYGGTVREAAARKLEEALRDVPDHHSGEHAKALLRALLMGLQDTAGGLYESLHAALRRDGNFLSLCETLGILNRLQQHGRMLGLEADKQIPKLVLEAYSNAVDKLMRLARTNENEHPAIIQGLKLLAMLAGSPDGQFESEGFRSHIDELLADRGLPPQLEGVCMAIAIALGDQTREELVGRARGYIRGTAEQAKLTAPYLQGVFEIARDAFLYDDSLLEELHYLIGELPHDDFIAMVPDLRLAFTYFTPMETGLIAQRVAGLYRVEPEALSRKPIEEGALIQARWLDKAIREEFAAWKLI